MAGARAEVCEEAKMFPQRKKSAALRLNIWGKVLPLGSADGAEEDGVRLFTSGDRFLRERGLVIGAVKRGATYEVLGVGDFKGEFFRNGVENLESFDHDFWADAVARKDGDGVGHEVDLSGILKFARWRGGNPKF